MANSGIENIAAGIIFVMIGYFVHHNVNDKSLPQLELRVLDGVLAAAIIAFGLMHLVWGVFQWIRLI